MYGMPHPVNDEIGNKENIVTEVRVLGKTIQK
jgi:hypothetical protein